MRGLLPRLLNAETERVKQAVDYTVKGGGTVKAKAKGKRPYEQESTMAKAKPRGMNAYCSTAVFVGVRSKDDPEEAAASLGQAKDELAKRRARAKQTDCDRSGPPGTAANAASFGGTNSVS